MLHITESEQVWFGTSVHHPTAPYHSLGSQPMLTLAWWWAQVHLAQMGLRVFQAQQKLEQMDKDQKQRSQAKARLNQQPPSPIAGPSATPATAHQQPGGLPCLQLQFLFHFGDSVCQPDVQQLTASEAENMLCTWFSIAPSTP